MARCRPAIWSNTFASAKRRHHLASAEQRDVKQQRLLLDSAGLVLGVRLTWSHVQVCLARPICYRLTPFLSAPFRVCGGLISVRVCVCDLVQCAAELLPGIDLPNTKVSVGESVRMGPPPMPRPWCRHPHGQPTPSRFGTQTKSTAICADGRSSRHRSPFIESSVSRSSRLFRRHAHTATVR